MSKSSDVENFEKLNKEKVIMEDYSGSNQICTQGEAYLEIFS